MKSLKNDKNLREIIVQPKYEMLLVENHNFKVFLKQFDHFDVNIEFYVLRHLKGILIKCV